MAASEEPQPRQGDPEAFKIGHLNIFGAIWETKTKKDREGNVKKKLDKLKEILERGSYDLFGVTEIRLSPTKPLPDIRIDGYTEYVYPSSHGKKACRGIAIYIKDEWLEMVSITEHVTGEKPQKQEGFEMVDVKFTDFRNDKLKITFLYRPRKKENLPHFKKILKESSEDQKVKRTIIMSDLNIDWEKEKKKEKDKRLTFDGVEQLVTEVTRPATRTAKASKTGPASCFRPATGTGQAAGTIMDHIWITNQLRHDQLYRDHGVDPYSHDTSYINSKKEKKRMSVHPIIWIDLERPKRTAEAEDKAAAGAAGAAGAARAAGAVGAAAPEEAQAQAEDTEKYDGDSNDDNEGTDEEEDDSDDSTASSEERTTEAGAKAAAGDAGAAGGAGGAGGAGAARAAGGAGGAEAAGGAGAAGGAEGAGGAGAVGAAEPEAGEAQADFKIGHLNIGGAILKDKLDELKRILVDGSYDIFGVTEIKFLKNEEINSRIRGYNVIVYPFSYDQRPGIGIAIYITTKLSDMEMHIAPQKPEKPQPNKPQKPQDFEMVHVKFNYFGTEKLRITFLHRPREDGNSLREILKELGEVQGVESIIMGDWGKEELQFDIDGVEKLVTKVTKPESETFIDHIRITRDINRLLNGEHGVEPGVDLSSTTTSDEQVNITSYHYIIRIALKQPEFKIGHLNINSVKDKLDQLKRILETGNFDIFGVTEIKLREQEETDIGITGYSVIAYPSSYGKTPSRGTAIYIKTKLSKVEMHIAPQELEGMEMVHVKFSGTEKLKITFLYRPENAEESKKNKPCFKQFLKESGKDPRVKSAIIMGDMNIDWKEERTKRPTNRLIFGGVQQLVTEVTHPNILNFGTIIDHIWITRDIIRLLDCDLQNRSLLNHYQNIIDALSRNQLDSTGQLSKLLRKKLDNQLDCEQPNHQHREELSRLVGGVLSRQLCKERELLLLCNEHNVELRAKLNMLHTKATNEQRREELDLLLDRDQIYPQHCEQRKNLNDQLTRKLRCLLASGEPKHQHLEDLKCKHKDHCQLLRDRGHGVDPYSTDTNCSDHRIIWIALKLPEDTEEDDDDSDDGVLALLG